MTTTEKARACVDAHDEVNQMIESASTWSDLQAATERLKQNHEYQNLNLDEIEDEELAGKYGTIWTREVGYHYQLRDKIFGAVAKQLDEAFSGYNTESEISDHIEGLTFPIGLPIRGDGVIGDTVRRHLERVSAS